MHWRSTEAPPGLGPIESRQVASRQLPAMSHLSMAQACETDSILSAGRAFDWGDGKSWLADIPSYAGHLLGRKLKARLKRAKTECWSDQMDWLEDDLAVEDFQSAFLGHYDFVRGYHGCRPVSVASYLSRGLIGQSKTAIENAFRQTFSDQPADRLNAAIDSMADRAESERGKIYFCGTERELIENCGHYLIQGSEYVMALAASLYPGYGEDFRLRLRKAGIPTIFQVDIPASYLHPLLLRAVCCMVLSAWGQAASGMVLGSDEPCYIVHRDIGPEYIRDHTHPTEIRDPHKLRQIYPVSGMSCDVCGTASAGSRNVVPGST